MTTRTPPSPEALRDLMVDRIRADGWALTPAVEQAMRTIPRHAFVTGHPLENAYGEAAVITKRAGTGAALSCASEPLIVAMMLDQLDVQPGHNILEVGAGTGYNAALLATLTGDGRNVTTVDIDPEVTAGARKNLDATGFEAVTVITRDGTLGDVEHGPYDRLILTVGTWDIPVAWWEQLRPGARIVVPLRWRGQTRSIAFAYTDGRLESDSMQLCGFVPLVGQAGEHTHEATDGVTLTWDTDQNINPSAIGTTLHRGEQASIWSTVTVDGEEPFDGVWLRLTVTDPATCRIRATHEAIDAGICNPAIPALTAALVEDTSIAYLALRRAADDGLWELGATGHGPAATALAERIVNQVKAWDTTRTATPHITVQRRADAHAETGTASGTIAKTHATMTLQYPQGGHVGDR
ncbi:methyltransferase, FxLD system [Actinoplanes sp. NPDC051861]|uniref:methyltransferase, FxLD system n=1 Tax=Actinoplanes sp. NPDC051861 TaxID=3155170 RepID=UPI00342C83D0